MECDTPVLPLLFSAAPVYTPAQSTEGGGAAKVEEAEAAAPQKPMKKVQTLVVGRRPLKTPSNIIANIITMCTKMRIEFTNATYYSILGKRTASLPLL